MSPPRLSAFDPGSQRFGWASGDGTCLPTAGAWRFPQVGERLGDMLLWLDTSLDVHYEQHRPDAVCYEAPILLRHDTLGRLRKTLNLGGHIEFWCARRGIACHEVDLRDVKKELAGFGGADKSDMVAAAERLGVTLPAKKADGREDAADAVGAWLLLLRAHSRALSSRFDAALYGRRGILI